MADARQHDLAAQGARADDRVLRAADATGCQVAVDPFAQDELELPFKAAAEKHAEQTLAQRAALLPVGAHAAPDQAPRMAGPGDARAARVGAPQVGAHRAACAGVVFRCSGVFIRRRVVEVVAVCVVVPGGCPVRDGGPQADRRAVLPAAHQLGGNEIAGGVMIVGRGDGVVQNLCELRHVLLDQAHGAEGAVGGDVPRHGAQRRGAVDVAVIRAQQEFARAGCGLHVVAPAALPGDAWLRDAVAEAERLARALERLSVLGVQQRQTVRGERRGDRSGPPLQGGKVSRVDRHHGVRRSLRRPAKPP